MTWLIDADALIEECNNVIEEVDASELKEDYYDGYEAGVENIRDFAEHMPTVDAEPVRHGKFIGTEYDGYADGYPVYYEWKCSECGCVFEEEEPTYRYCPNCGARMDKDV